MRPKHYAKSPGALAYVTAMTLAKLGHPPPATNARSPTAAESMRKVLAQSGTQAKAHVSLAERKTAAGNMRALIGRSDAA